MDISAHTTQVNGGNEVGQKRIVDRVEGGLRALKSTVGKKAKRRLYGTMRSLGGSLSGKYTGVLQLLRASCSS